MNKLSWCCGLAVLVIAVPLAAQAGAVWRTQAAEFEIGTQEQSWLTKIAPWLAGRAVAVRPAVGTKFTVRSSAYASSPYQTDDTPCLTAAGTRVRSGVVASNFLPLGAILSDGDRLYIVEDRMNSRYQGQYIDIWFPSTSEALEFGRRTLQMEIIDYGTPGQEVKLDEEGGVIEPGFIKRAGLRFIATARTTSNGMRAGVNDKYDVDCFATE